MEYSCPHTHPNTNTTDSILLVKQSVGGKKLMTKTQAINNIYQQSYTINQARISFERGIYLYK